MKAWWLGDTARLGAEKRAVEALQAEGWFRLTRWHVHEFRLAADGNINARGAKYPVRLIYPDQFPSVPAWVEPQDPEAKWSGHQYGKGGVLCLELRPDNWSSAATGADVLRSARNLLDTENPLGEGENGQVQSAHSVGNIQAYDWGQEPVLIGVGCFIRILKGEAQNVRALRWRSEDNVWPILVSDAADRERAQRPPGFDFGSLRAELPVVIARGAIPEPTPAGRAGLASALGTVIDVEDSSGAVVIVVAKDDAAPFHSADPEKVFRRKWILLPDTSGVRSGRTTAAAGKKVAIVGAGSVGSKLAETLLRSGIHNMVLVDGDVLLPDNLERNALDWRDVGFRKANAAKRRLLHIVPGANIRAIAGNLNWQRSAQVQAEYVEAIGECDLIIDATGDIPTALTLGAVAAENEKPFVSAQVFEGGLGCVVSRSLPGRDPPFVEGRARYLAFCEQENEQPPKSGQRRYEAFTGEGHPVVADDAAVTIAAGHAGRVALDIVDEQVRADEGAWLLIGFKPGWLFNHHGHIISVDTGLPAKAQPPEHDAAARAFALALAKEALDAAKAPK